MGHFLPTAYRLLYSPLKRICRPRFLSVFDVPCKQGVLPSTLHRDFSQTARCWSISSTGVYKSNLPDVEIPSNMNLVEYVMKDFDRFGDREALVDGITGRAYTFSQLKELVYKCASGFRINGFQPGFMCAIHLPNVPEYTIAMFAVLAAGGVVTTVNPLLMADDVTHQLSSTKPDVIITLSVFVETVRKVEANVPSVKEVYVIGEENEFEGCKQFSSLLDNDGSVVTKPTEIGSDTDRAVIPYSSGTTGLPKGVVISHTAFITILRQFGAPSLFRRDFGDSVLALLPFFHIYGMTLVQCFTLVTGARLVTLPKFDAQLYLQTLQDYKITVSPIVPPIALLHAKHPMVDNYDLSNLKEFICGAAPISEELPEVVVQRTNSQVVFKQGYGMTEVLSHISHGYDASQWTKGACGSLLPNMEAKIIDLETGDVVQSGTVGEICLRGPTTMSHYYDNEKATRDLIDEEGWVHTADIGYIDDKEQLHVVDRQKDLIKYKGFQVAPAELEALLISHPNIEDAAVIGVPDERAGEVPKAFVVRGDKNLSEDDVFKFVEANVPPFKMIRGGVEFIDEVPTSPSGKILRRILREREPRK